MRGPTTKSCVVFLAIAAASLVGCATTRFQPRSFTETEAGQLFVGERPAEVRTTFGSPHMIYSTRLGKDVGKEWDGLVWEYLGQKNPIYSYLDKRLRNRLVFALVDGDTLLNNWELEDVVVAPPSR